MGAWGVLLLRFSRMALEAGRATAGGAVRRDHTRGLSSCCAHDTPGHSQPTPSSFAVPALFPPAHLLPSQASTPATSSLASYFTLRCAPSPSITALLTAPQNAGTLFVLHERMVNLPPQIGVPLYRMLFEEIGQAPVSFASRNLPFPAGLSRAASDKH